MNWSASDFVVHIDEVLSGTQQHEVRDAVTHIRGVESATINPSRPHLMRVEFHPETVRSFDIMRTLGSKGLRVERVS